MEIKLQDKRFAERIFKPPPAKELAPIRPEPKPAPAPEPITAPVDTVKEQLIQALILENAQLMRVIETMQQQRAGAVAQIVRDETGLMTSIIITSD